MVLGLCLARQRAATVVWHSYLPPCQGGLGAAPCWTHAPHHARSMLQSCCPAPPQPPQRPTSAAASSMVITTSCSNGVEAVDVPVKLARPKGDSMAPLATMKRSPGWPSHLISSSARLPDTRKMWSTLGEVGVEALGGRR